MKRTVALVVVIVMILGLCFTGVSALAANNSSNSQGPGGTRQVELVEELTLGPGETYESEWLDVKLFRNFKLYAYLTPYDEDPCGEVEVRILESATGVGKEAYGLVDEAAEWTEWDSPPEHWSAACKFIGLYSYVAVTVENRLDEDITISLYLLMTEDYPPVKVVIEEPE